jgi:dipeptidyl aminopeptidase/acylaminoacyl peptidase
VLLVHGTADSTVSVRRSRNYAQAARAAGANVELIEIAGEAGSHRSHIFPASASWTAVAEWLEARRDAGAEPSAPPVATAGATEPAREG